MPASAIKQTKHEKTFSPKKKTGWLIFLSLLLVACSPAYNNGNVSVTATDGPDIDIQSATATQPTLPVSTTEDITETVLQLEINQACIEIEPNLKTDSEGTLVFQEEYGDRLIFINAQTGNRKIVPDVPNMQVYRDYVSPDAKWLIYQLDWGEQNGETKFILARSDGIPQAEIPFGDWGVSSIFWLNKETLRVAQPDNAVTSINNFALNPFDGTTSSLPSDFPDLGGRGLDWGVDRNAVELGVTRGINLIYDPTLTRILYPKNDNSISLFDLETNQEIANLTISGRGKLPKWSPDGRKLAIIGKTVDSSKGTVYDEFHIISRDGINLERLSYSPSIGKQVHIENFSWSPDGNQIALWLKTETSTSTTDQNSFELAVLDLETNVITNYCISGTSTIEYETYTDPVDIIWSPDSTQLLIVRYKNDNNKDTDELIVDLENKTAYKIAENMQPIGWMTPQP